MDGYIYTYIEREMHARTHACTRDMVFRKTHRIWYQDITNKKHSTHRVRHRLCEQEEQRHEGQEASGSANGRPPPQEQHLFVYKTQTKESGDNQHQNASSGGANNTKNNNNSIQKHSTVRITMIHTFQKMQVPLGKQHQKKNIRLFVLLHKFQNASSGGQNTKNKKNRVPIIYTLQNASKFRGQTTPKTTTEKKKNAVIVLLHKFQKMQVPGGQANNTKIQKNRVRITYISQSASSSGKKKKKSWYSCVRIYIYIYTWCFFSLVRKRKAHPAHSLLL